MRAGACRVLELFIELVRSSKGTPRYGGTPPKARMVAGAADGCNRQLTKIPANQRFLPALTGAFLLRSPPCETADPKVAAARRGRSAAGLLVHRIDTIGRGRADGAERRQAGRRASQLGVGGAPAALRGRGLPRPGAGGAGAPRGPLERARPGGGRRDAGERRSCAARSPPRSDGSAALLRELYVQGEPDPIAVILGATSLDEAMAGIEGLSRATAQNERLVRRGGRRRAGGSTELRVDLAAQRDAARRRPRRRARRRRRRLAAAVAGQRETVASDPPPGRR